MDERRAFLLLLAGAAPVAAGASAAAAAQPAAGVRSDASRQRFVRRAFELRDLAAQRGDQPFGAVVVRGDEIVGEGVSAVLTAPDPTAHGEIQALRDAARRLKSARLSGCELVSSFRPCPMCEAAAYWAGIERIWYGDGGEGGYAPSLRRC
jgi:tRNA(Arg) A34 adenosine deaminase TadA